jgi:outer membrane protein TolC
MAEVELANLKFQMGLNLDEVIILKDKLDDLRASVVPQQNAFDPKNRVEYQLLTAAITLDGYNMRAKRSGYYPSLGGFLNYSGNVQTEAFSDMFKGSEWYPQGLVGIKLNVPIFDSGLKYAQVQQVKLEQMKRQNSRDNFVNAANLQYQSALSNFNAALGDEVSAQKTLDLSKKIFTTNEAKFKQGAGSSFELQQSEQEYATNELKQIQTIINLLNAKADLDKAMGVK